MEYKLTKKCQLNKRGKDKKCKSYLIYFLNDVQILKQKLPFESDYENGFNHLTGFNNVYLLNGKLHQTRIKFEKTRDVSYPISKNKLNQLEVPIDLKIKLTK